VGLHETVKQAREAYTRFAGSADRAEAATAKMEEHERRTASLVALQKIRRTNEKWERRLDGVLAGLVGGLVVAVALWLFWR